MLPDTQVKILEVGKQEFLEKGFVDASLRNIAAGAGVTTGAIYGYYPDKNALFRDLVEPAASEFKERFTAVQESFIALPEEEQIHKMRNYSDDSLGHLLAFIYQHMDAFRLIACSSAGTPYEGYIESLVNIETQSTIAFAKVLKKAGYRTRKLSDNLIHILCNAYFSAIFETVAHDMSKEEADDYVADITAFFKAGWAKIFDFDGF